MRVFYLRNEAGFPVACVASEKDGEIVKVAMSALNPKDKENFDRSRGRAIAEGRLAKGKLFTTLKLHDGAPIKMRLMRLILASSDSGMARQAAELWLKRTGQAANT